VTGCGGPANSISSHLNWLLQVSILKSLLKVCLHFHWDAVFCLVVLESDSVGCEPIFLQLVVRLWQL